MSGNENLTSWRLKLRGKEDKHFVSIFEIKEFSFSNDSQFFSVLSENGTIFIFSTDNQKLLKKFQSKKPYCYKSIAWSCSFLAAANKNAIKIWHIDDESLFKVININDEPKNIKFSTDGKNIAIFWLQFIHILDIDNSLITLKLTLNKWSSIGWAWSPCGNFESLMLNENNEIIWSVDNQKILIENEAIEKYSLISISHCENTLILICNWNTISVWNLEDTGQDKKEIRKIKKFSYKYRIRNLMWSSDGKSIIASDDRGNVIVWDFISGKIIKKIAAGKWASNFIDISVRRRFIISGGDGVRPEVAKMWKL